MDVGRINVGSTALKTDSSLEAPVKTNRIETVKEDVKAPAKPSESEVKAAVDIANKVLFNNNTHLQFTIHEKTKDVLVKIINDATGEVVLEVPPEKLVDMVAKMCEIAGILIDEKR